MENGLKIVNGEGMFIEKSMDGKYITVGDENFELKFADNLPMFMSLDSLMDGEEDDYLSIAECLFRMWFTDCNTLWDCEYVNAKRDLIKGYIERVRKRIMKVSGKDTATVVALAGGLEN